MTIHERGIFALALLWVSASGCDVDPSGDRTTGATSAATASPGTTDDTSGGATDPTAGDPTTGTAPAEIPADLRGVWLDSWSTSMGYLLATEMYNFETGVWFMGHPSPWDMAPYRGYGISFDQSGNFTWVLGSDGGLGGCKSYAIDFMKGTAEVVDHDTIRFHAADRRQLYHSTCDPSLNYEQDASGGVFEMDYVLGTTQDTGLPTLRIVNTSDGTAFDYFKN